MTPGLVVRLCRLLLLPDRFKTCRAAAFPHFIRALASSSSGSTGFEYYYYYILHIHPQDLDSGITCSVMDRSVRIGWRRSPVGGLLLQSGRGATPVLSVT